MERDTERIQEEFGTKKLKLVDDILHIKTLQEQNEERVGFLSLSLSCPLFVI